MALLNQPGEESPFGEQDLRNKITNLMDSLLLEKGIYVEDANYVERVIDNLFIQGVPEYRRIRKLIWIKESLSIYKVRSPYFKALLKEINRMK